MADAVPEPHALGNSQHASGNSRALIVVIVLFGTITAAQFVGALAARSEALLIDSVCMMVDTLTYVFNLCADRCKRDVADLTAAGVSLVILLGISVWGIVDACQQLQDTNPQEDLSPDIVLAFGCWGIIFDCFSCLGFIKWGLPGLLPGRHDRSYEEFGESAPPESSRKASSEAHALQKSSAMNMRSAFMHVSADFLRSLVIVTEGLVVKVVREPGRETDSIAALIVSATILLGACGAIVPWFKQMIKWRRRYTAEALEPKSPSMDKPTPTSIGSIGQAFSDPSAV